MYLSSYSSSCRFENQEELLLKRANSMVFTLPGNVRLDFVRLDRLTLNAPYPGLPCKTTQAGKGLVNPSRGVGFDVADNVRNGRLFS